MKFKIIKIATLFFLISSSVYAQTGNAFYGTNAGGTINTGSYNSFFGYDSGKQNSTGTKNVFSGYSSGKNNTSGNANVFLGYHSGSFNDSGNLNIAVGNKSLYSNVSSSENTSIGSNSLQNLTSGNGNTTIGYSTLNKLTMGERNVAIGRSAGSGLVTGDFNTFLGYGSGFQNTNGSGNVFVGYHAGGYEQGSDKFYLSTTANTNKLLLYGDFTTKQLAIGTNNIPTTILTSQGGSYALFVPRGILTDEVKVKTGWADYVFEESYELPSLKEESAFIESNGHLMNFPSAKEIEKAGGVDLGKMVVLQQETIEKMMLHIIRLEEKIDNVK